MRDGLAQKGGLNAGKLLGGVGSSKPLWKRALSSLLLTAVIRRALRLVEGVVLNGVLLCIIVRDTSRPPERLHRGGAAKAVQLLENVPEAKRRVVELGCYFRLEALVGAQAVELGQGGVEQVRHRRVSSKPVVHDRHVGFLKPVDHREDVVAQLHVDGTGRAGAASLHQRHVIR